MSEPTRLESYFAPMLGSDALERAGLLPEDARELIEMSLAQDRVIRHLATIVALLQCRAKLGVPTGKHGVRWSLPPVPSSREEAIGA